MIITVTRRAQDIDSDYGVFGLLEVDGAIAGYTTEQPWRDNAKGRSCVPAGEYELLPHNSTKYGPVVVLSNPDLDVYPYEGDVPEAKRGVARATCLIHAANWPDQLQGCIAPGAKITMIGGKLGVTSSAATLGRLRQRWGDRRGHRLIVRWES